MRDNEIEGVRLKEVENGIYSLKNSSRLSIYEVSIYIYKYGGIDRDIKCLYLVFKHWKCAFNCKCSFILSLYFIVPLKSENNKKKSRLCIYVCLEFDKREMFINEGHT